MGTRKLELGKNYRRGFETNEVEKKTTPRKDSCGLKSFSAKATQVSFCINPLKKLLAKKKFKTFF